MKKKFTKPTVKLTKQNAADVAAPETKEPFARGGRGYH